MKKAALICSVFVLIQCSEIEPGPPISPFVDLLLMDNGNSGYGGDIEALDTQRNTANVAEYKFFMVKEDIANSFDMSDAENLNQDRFFFIFIILSNMER